ncbi:MAG: glycine cleavage system protein R [Planctomycetota bacterium]|nr:glycine cleavage system protein R [Planctomycetota bacterium]
MATYAVLTALGSDRPGLVEAVSKYILDCGCNIEDSRMAILGGEFAMLILVAGPASALDKLVKNVSAASHKSGLAIQAHRTKVPGEAAPKGTLPYEIEAFSMDHPGIVQRVAGFLAERRINIRALDTRLTNAPVTGLPLFSLHATVDVPADQNVSDLRRGLEALAAHENIDIEMKPAK